MAKKRRKSIQQDIGRGQWSAPWVFVLAASGAAIGLKNIWQFPFLVQRYGGGAFIVVYLFCVLLIGLPLLIAEFMLGHNGRQSPVTSMCTLAQRSQRARAWGQLGWVGMCAGFLILSYLSVIAGWVMAYSIRMAVGVLDGLTEDGMQTVLTVFVGDPEKQLLWHSLFMAMTITIVARGVKAGLEPLVKYAVPALFVIMIVLLVYAAITAEFAQAATQLFYPDFTKLGGVGVLAAMGHAFFSLGLGVGAMLVFAAYLQRDACIPGLAAVVAGIDTLAGVIGGLVVLAVLLAGGFTTVAHPQLLFQALPLSFDQLPWGRPLGALFFCSLVLAAWLSAVALIEPLIAWMGEALRVSRVRAAVICGVGAWLLGVVTVLSFNYWRFSFKFLGVVKTLGTFDGLQIFTAGFLLPTSAVLISLYSGWVLRSQLLRDAFSLRAPCAYDVWLWSVRVVTPGLMLVVFANIQQLVL